MGVLEVAGAPVKAEGWRRVRQEAPTPMEGVQMSRKKSGMAARRLNKVSRLLSDDIQQLMSTEVQMPVLLMAAAGDTDIH